MLKIMNKKEEHNTVCVKLKVLQLNNKHVIVGIVDIRAKEQILKH